MSTGSWRAGRQKIGRILFFHCSPTDTIGCGKQLTHFQENQSMAASASKYLVTGASGQLGSYLVQALQRQQLPIVAWSRQPNTSVLGVPCESVDIRERDLVRAAFERARPDVVIHAAAMSGVGDCFRDPAGARQTNTNGTRFLADLADKHGIRILYVSTDLVFDGRHRDYRETDCPTPLSVYGQTKATAEREVLSQPNHVVVRVSLLFGPAINGRTSFFDQQIQAVRNGTPMTLFNDEWRTPVSLAQAAEGLITAAQSDVSGILHLGWLGTHDPAGDGSASGSFPRPQRGNIPIGKPRRLSHVRTTPS
jgi:dTDP-4-dehydrorhamnose reductase